MLDVISFCLVWLGNLGFDWLANLKKSKERVLGGFYSLSNQRLSK